MKLGKIIGRVISTQKTESFDGLKLLLVQPLDENLTEYGDPIVSVDTVLSNIGQIIYYEVSKEASMVMDKIMCPCDAAIVGIADEVNIQEKL